CSVIQTILANIMDIRLEKLIAPTGPCKCDSMRFLLPIIKRISPGTEIMECTNNDIKNFGYPICESGIPLVKKFEMITADVTKTKFDSKTGLRLEKTRPAAGFWGVPPYDFSILKLFPDNTHVFGWTRCMENKTPHNPRLELHVESELPTVFFSQAFCQKNILAKELASIHKGLYVEVDGAMDKSTQAKITAFLELKNCY
ncbi:MAG: hypothetical protein NTY22_09880, partial [Proteobacteria bacterium]|nr:hypothetical protein [Pseudomonadota bacterium]